MSCHKTFSVQIFANAKNSCDRKFASRKSSVCDIYFRFFVFSCMNDGAVRKSSGLDDFFKLPVIIIIPIKESSCIDYSQKSHYKKSWGMRSLFKVTLWTDLAQENPQSVAWCCGRKWSCIVRLKGFESAHDPESVGWWEGSGDSLVSLVSEKRPKYWTFIFNAFLCLQSFFSGCNARSLKRRSQWLWGRKRHTHTCITCCVLFYKNWKEFPLSLQFGLSKNRFISIILEKSGDNCQFTPIARRGFPSSVAALGEGTIKQVGHNYGRQGRHFNFENCS